MSSTKHPFKVGQTVRFLHADGEFRRGKTYEIRRVEEPGYSGTHAAAAWTNPQRTYWAWFDRSLVEIVSEPAGPDDIVRLEARLKAAKAAVKKGKEAAAKRAKTLASLNAPQRALVDYFDANTDAFGCQRKHVLAVLSIVAGKDLASLLKGIK